MSLQIFLNREKMISIFGGECYCDCAFWQVPRAAFTSGVYKLRREDALGDIGPDYAIMSEIIPVGFTVKVVGSS